MLQVHTHTRVIQRMAKFVFFLIWINFLLQSYLSDKVSVSRDVQVLSTKSPKTTSVYQMAFLLLTKGTFSQMLLKVLRETNRKRAVISPVEVTRIF